MKSTLRRAALMMLCSVIMACPAGAQNYYGAPQAGGYGGGYGGQLSGSPMGMPGGYGYGYGGAQTGNVMGAGTAIPSPQMPNTSLFSSGTPAFEGSGSRGGGSSTRGSVYGAPSAVGMGGAADAAITAPAATTVQTGPVSGPVVSQPMAAQPMVSQPMASQEIVAQPIYGQVTGTQFGAPYMDAMSSGHWEPVYGPVATGGTSAPRWFGGVYGLIMDRDNENEIYFLTAPATTDSLFLSSNDAQMETSGGFEARIGRTFGGGNWGIEAIYWSLFPSDQSAEVFADGQPFYTTMDYRDVFLDFGPDYPYDIGDAPPVTASNVTESGNIVSARLDRSFDIQNIELNLLSRPIYAGGGLRAGRARPFGRGFAGGIGSGGYGGGGNCGGGSAAMACGDPCGGGCGPSLQPSSCGPRMHIGWLFGVRYFKFDESLGLTYNIADPVFPTLSTPAFRHDVEAENDLVGVQLGLNMDYYLTQRLQFEAGSRFGLYGNHSTVTQRVFNDFGPGFIDYPDNPQAFDVRASDNDVSFIGELRAGLAYKLGCHWRITGGYRALAASRIALATNQLPFGRTFNALDKAGQVNTNGDLILHGAYAGLEFAW